MRRGARLALGPSCAFREVTHEDFPEKWPDHLPNIVAHLKSGCPRKTSREGCLPAHCRPMGGRCGRPFRPSQSGRYCGLMALRKICGKYTMKSEANKPGSRDPLNATINATFDLLLPIVTELLKDPTSDNMEMVRASGASGEGRFNRVAAGWRLNACHNS